MDSFVLSFPLIIYVVAVGKDSIDGATLRQFEFGINTTVLGLETELGVENDQVNWSLIFLKFLLVQKSCLYLNIASYFYLK